VVSSEELRERLLRNLAAEHARVRDIVGDLPAHQADKELEDFRPKDEPSAEAPQAEQTRAAAIAQETASAPEAAILPAVIPSCKSVAPRVLRIEIEQDLPVMMVASADVPARSVRLRSLQLILQEADEAASDETEPPQAEAESTPMIGHEFDPEPDALTNRQRRR
jgi:hypothetical protein